MQRDRLLELLRIHSFRKGTFTLTSGRTSDFFIDCKPVVLRAEGHALVGDVMRAVLPEDVVAVAGVELGGCPLASSVAQASFRTERPVDAIYVRKAAKEHGSKKELEGAGHLPAGARLAVLEDTVTTGGSTIRACERLRAHGFEVVMVVAIVDRLEGGAQALADAGLPFTPIFTRRDFMGDEGPAG